METIEMLINELDSEILQAKNATFSKTDIVLNKEKMLEIVARLRRSYPTVIKEAYETMEEKDKILKDAEDYANSVMDKAEEQANILISQEEVVKRANAYAQQIRMEADEYFNKTDYDARLSSYSILEDIENVLNNSLDIINENKKKLIK